MAGGGGAAGPAPSIRHQPPGAPTRTLTKPNYKYTDTSMITLSTEYAAHFHDVYINGKENAKMTGDRMKMLMLTLPFMVRDLIAPEVISMYLYVLVHTVL